jgi:hypothetical protein
LIKVPSKLEATLQTRCNRLEAKNKKARKCKLTGDRQRYNSAIYRVAWSMANSVTASKLAKLSGSQGVGAGDFVYMLFGKTSGDKRRLIWTHRSALEYAARRDVVPDDLEGFLARKGGLKKCAARMAKVRRKKAAK